MLADQMITIQGVNLPRFFYGTAWKEELTQELTTLALQCGFRAIDTANQRKHYCEAAVGEAIAKSISAGTVTREELFLQTKFTFQRGQDHRLPYNPRAAIPLQVEQSFTSSLKHLGTDRLDSYVLHGPTTTRELMPDDWAAWRAMEAIHDSGRVRLLGVSNVTLGQLRALCRDAKVQPSFVQNRCFADQAWDGAIREFCRSHDITYQGFSLLTANRTVLRHRELQEIAERHDRTPPQIVFRFALEVGMIPLTGTSDANHMRADLDVFNFELSDDEVQRLEQLAIK